MGYTAVRGGLEAIEQAETLVDSMPIASDEPLKLSQLERHMQIAIAQELEDLPEFRRHVLKRFTSSVQSMAPIGV